MEQERSYYDEKGRLVWERIVDHAPVINENDERQKDGRNGFSPGRQFRQIGSIPADAFHRWALSAGYYQMDKIQRNFAVRKYLNDHPEFRTVERLVNHGPNDSNVIIK